MPIKNSATNPNMEFASVTEANNCFNCKWVKQGSGCMHCSNPNAIIFIDIKKPCENCGRKPNENKGGCGSCLGRGKYCYPYAYDQCDCGGFEKK